MPHDEQDSPILSPKQQQQRLERAAILCSIQQQVQQILTSNSISASQQEHYLAQLTTIQTLYIKENKQLRQVIIRLRNEYQQLQGLYLATKLELESSVEVIERMLGERKGLEEDVGKLEGEVMRLKEMICNQQELLEEYRVGVEEETELEREVLRAQFEEQRARVQRQFAKALSSMQQQYESRLKRVTSHQQLQQYRRECGKVRTYLHQSNNKQNKLAHTDMRKSSISKVPSSLYSTAACTEHHNRGVFVD